MTSSTASALIQCLEQYDVSSVFGIPGVHTLELYRHLATSNIKHITPRHEQGAGFMADGYARVSNKPGVCFIISGPGMTNMITAMAQAWSESIPMLVISSVNSHGNMGSGDGWLHELGNQQALINGVCAFSHTLHKPSELKQVLARAFSIFGSERPRPVHIEIPINILSAEYVEENAYKLKNKAIVQNTYTSIASPALLIHAAQLLVDGSRPVILVGGGARHSAQALQNLAEQLDAPVVMTVNARGILATTHPLAVSASASLPAVRALIAQADVVLGIGTEMGPTDYDFNEDGKFDIPGIFVRIDIDAQQIQRSHQPQLALVGDANATCCEILKCVSSLQNGSPKKSANNSLSSRGDTTCSGQQLAATAITQTLESLNAREKNYIQSLVCIRDSLNNVIIVGDSTQLIYAGNSAFGMDTPGSWFNSAMGFGTLGYALPAALGAAHAVNRNRPIVAICGDGGLQFCLAELASAIDAKLKIILIVHENGGYKEINNFMQTKSIDPVGVELMAPDFSAIATAFQWEARRLESMQYFSSTLQEAAKNNAPTMIIIDDALFDNSPS